MISANIIASLNRRAQQIGARHTDRLQSEVETILQEALPDGEVEHFNDGRVLVRARGIFSRILKNERLRNIGSFLI